MPVPRCVIAQPEVVKVGDPKKTSTESKSKGGAISAIFTDVVVEGIAGQVKKLIDDGFNAGVKGMQKVIDDQAGNIVELRNEVKVLKQMGEEDKEELKMLREFRSRVLEAVKSAGGGVGGP